VRGIQETRWHERLVGDLERLWAEGLGTEQIADRLGLTKNAVIGKAHRLGLPRREASDFQRKRVSSKYLTAVDDRGDGTPHPFPIYYATIAKVGAVSDPTRRTAPGLRDTTVTPCDPPPEERVAFENLESRHCRWPFGDKEVTYCGRHKELGVSYCPGHLDRSKYGL
jgi:GcrA cell cycle regulator